MDTNKLSGIVVYTIHGNDALRDAIRAGIQEKFTSKPLDESTYGISIQDKIRDDVKITLTSICEKAKGESKSEFLNDDFVCLYHPTFKEESGDNRYIKQVYIVAPKRVL